MIDDDIPVRLSHLLRECAVGAIVRGPEYLVTVKDTTRWRRSAAREIRYAEHVRRVLDIEQKLCAPPTASRGVDGRLTGKSIPSMRFPAWTRCSRCGILHHRPWRRKQESDTHVESGDRRGTLRCGLPERDNPSGGDDGNRRVCFGTLEQVPWVLAHERGYLADVPWHGVAHGDARAPTQRDCRPDRTTPYLKIERTDRGYRVTCRKCQASGELGQRFPFSKTTWQQPWHAVPVEPDGPDGLEEPGWILEINDVRVHSADTPSALVIPPESRIRRGTVVDRLFASTSRLEAIRSAREGLSRKSTLKRIADELRCRPQDVEEAIREIDNGYPLYEKSIPADDLLLSEYRALTGEIPDLEEDENFVTEHFTSAWSARTSSLGGTPGRLARAVDRLVVVRRLKEIMALKGFRRCGGELPTPPDLTGDCDWLPALELYGEGIFFSLREETVRRWEARDAVRQRADMFLDRSRGACLPRLDGQQISPRYLLLHTLAHLMIRQLEVRAGYPAASIRERLYSSHDPDGGAPSMSGVLLYVAVPDSEGSLGGLMKQAEPDAFLRLLTAALETAAWCSFDPACREQDGHGPDLLNRAACHACALVPEPSCAIGNVLLDRTFVTGGAGEPVGFFDDAPTAGGNGDRR